LAVLTKGLVALAIAGPVVLLFLLVTGTPRARYLRMLDPLGVALFLLVGLPWHVAAALQRSDFLWYYFVNEHFLRYVGLREPHDYYSGPIYYYVPRIFLYLAPWSILLPALLWRRRRARGSGDRLGTFLWIWVAVIFVLFSLSSAKANYYLVTAAPPLALLLGQRLTSWALGRRVAPLQWFAAVSVAAIAVAIGVVHGLCEPGRDALWPLCQGASATAAAATGAYAIAAFGLCWALRPRAIPLILSVAGLVVPVLYVALEGAGSAGQWISQKEVVETLKLEGDDRPLFLFRDFESISAVVFYSRRRLPIINSVSGDLLFGQQTISGAGWFLTSEDFARRATQGPLYVLMRSKQALHFDDELGHLGFCTVLAVGGSVVVGNTTEDCVVDRRGEGEVQRPEESSTGTVP
jgi:4-amino-4-deoxy-L-arabinose transferase-like glycosyltransferase